MSSSLGRAICAPREIVERAYPSARPTDALCGARDIAEASLGGVLLRTAAHLSGDVQQGLLDSGQQLRDQFGRDLLLAADAGVTTLREARDLP